MVRNIFEVDVGTGRDFDDDQVLGTLSNTKPSESLTNLLISVIVDQNDQ